MIKINNKLPKNWEIKTLAEVCEIKSGKNQKKVINPNGKYPIYGSSGIFGYADEYICDENTTIIGRKGTINSPIYVTTKFWNVDTAFGLCVKENLNSKFLFYFCLGFNFKKLDKSTTIPSLSKGDLLSIELHVPALESQTLIVSKIEELFSELDKGIEDLKTAQLQLKIYRQSVLKYAFEGKLTNKKVKEGELPKRWKMVNMSTVIEKPKYGTSKKCDYVIDGNGVLRIPNISKGIVDSSDLKFAKFDDKEIETYSLIEGDILTIRSNGSVDLVGKCALISKKDEGYLYAGYLIRLRPIMSKINPKYLINILSSIDLRNQIEDKAKSTSGVNNINSEELSTLKIQLPPIEEQNLIVQEIESRLSVADKMEESIVQSLLQAESLRQTILKKAFSGELVKEVIQGKIHKPKNDYFFQMQLIGKIAAISKRNKIEQGEMTIAKYAYLSDKLFGIPTGFEFNRWHLGPYPPAIKKVVNNKQYFQRIGNHIEVINEQTLFKSTNDFSTSIDDAVSNLVSLFSKYKTSAERSHKTELLATVCKVIEDIKTTDLKLVRASMKEWKIILKTSSFKNKAEKFNEEETKNCIEFIAKKGWVKKLIK